MVNDFPVPSWDVTTPTLPGEEKFNFSRPGKVKVFPARESLVSDIPAGDGKIVKLFLQCNHPVSFSNRYYCNLSRKLNTMFRQTLKMIY
jgi:hypothetical protein